MREVAAAGETALGAGRRPVPMGVLAQELAGRLRDALDQLTLPEWGWPAGLADLAGRARRRRLRRGIAAVSTIVVALIAVAALLAVPGRPGRGPLAARLAFRQLTSVWFNSPSAVLAYGGGSLFAVLTDPARLVRLDPASLAVTGALPLGSPGFDLDPVAYGDGAVWVLGSSGTQLWRIDPATMRITRQQRTGGDATAVAYGDGAVWVAGSSGKPGNGIELERFDPGSGQLTGLARLPGNQSTSCLGWGRAAASQRLRQPAATLAVGKVILAAGPGTPVYAISPRRMSIRRAFHVGTGCDAPPRLAAGPHGLYATVGSAVVRLDLATGRIAARGPATGLNVPDSEPLIVALGGLWYTPTGFYRVGAAIRLDPVTLTVTARTKIYASALLAVGHNLYVSEYGGVIRVQVTGR